MHNYHAPIINHNTIENFFNGGAISILAMVELIMTGLINIRLLSTDKKSSSLGLPATT